MCLLWTVSDTTLPWSLRSTHHLFTHLSLSLLFNHGFSPPTLLSTTSSSNTLFTAYSDSLLVTWSLLYVPRQLAFTSVYLAFNANCAIQLHCVCQTVPTWKPIKRFYTFVNQSTCCITWGKKCKLSFGQNRRGYFKTNIEKRLMKVKKNGWKWNRKWSENRDW